MVSDAHVVGDLDEVVEFDAVAEDGGAERGAVDGGAGSDLASVAEDDIAELWHLFVTSVRRSKPEAIGAHDGTGLEDAVAADHGVRSEHATGADAAALSDLDVPAHDGAGLNDATGADGGTRPDVAKGPDGDAGLDAGLRMDHCTRVDGSLAILLLRRGREGLHELGHGRIGVGHPNQGRARL